MKELDRQPYYNSREQLGNIFLLGREMPLQARNHIEQQQLRGGAGDEIIRVTPNQLRTYMHSRLFVKGTLREMDLAEAQSWFYPKDKTIVIHELVPEAVAQFTDPRESLLYRQMWMHYEDMLIGRFPGADHLVTGIEDQWGVDRWKGFVNAVGYDQAGPSVFRKTIGPPFA